MARRYRGPFDPFDPRPFEGFGEIHLPRPPRRFWVGLGFFAAALLILFATSPLVGLVTETEWYTALGLRGVYLTRVALQAWLFFGALLVALLAGGVNVAATLRLRAGAGLRAVGIRRRVLRTPAGYVGLALAAVIALVLAASARGSWRELALFLHARPAGVTEPLYGMDVSFYLLTLPFLQALFGWLFALVFMTGLLALGLHAWRGDTFDFRLAPRALGHLSVVLGVLALVTAAGTFLDRYSLLYSHNGVVWGAGYVDVHVRSGLVTARAALAVLLAGMLFANAALRQVRVVVGVVAVWVLVAIFGAAYPAIVQRVQVQPSEALVESPYISREITFTRRAFGVDHVGTQPYGGSTPLTRKAVEDDQTTIDNLRLWDNQQMQETYSQLQSIRTYYEFRQIDLDRYRIDGRTQQVEISARELDQGKLPPQAQNWVNQKLQYTHGYGVAASPVSAVVGEGLPDYVVKDLPPSGALPVTRPEIYFGQRTDGYVLAPSASREFDYPSATGDVFNTYQGTHGVKMVGASRVLWAMRTGDFNLLVSGQVQDRTQLLYRRDVQDRIRAIAPFLQLDDNPYVVVVNGRVYWIQDADISANTYPYSRQESLAGDQNYLRNSAKVVVDAYDGTVRFYISDPNDPIIRAYADTFPGMFRPLLDMPPDLIAHIRVPQHLFQVQTAVYATYHVSNPTALYLREDIWEPAVETPYYVEMRLPGQTQAEYLQIQPFEPLHKQNLISWLAVRNDAPHYGQLVAYTLPKDKVVLGPKQVASRIQQTPAFSSARTLLNQQGSSLIEGNLLAVPVGDTFLYFEPIYLRANGGGAAGFTSLPELKSVLLADATGASPVAYQPTLKEALAALVGEAVSLPPNVSGQQPQQPSQPGASPQLAALVSQALDHYDKAQTALKAGDLATYGREIQQVGQLLQQIDQVEHGGTATASPSPPGRSPAPRASPTASARASP